LADGDFLGLNKRGSLNLNLRGVGDATGVEVGLAATSVIAFLRPGLGFGEGTGDAATDGDVALSANGVVSVSFCVRCFGGEGDSAGVPVSSCD